MGKGDSRKGHEKRAQWLPLISDFPLRVSLWYWAYSEATIVISSPAGLRKMGVFSLSNTLQNESQVPDLRMRLERSSSSSVWCLMKEGAAGFGIRWHPCCLKLHWSPWGHPCNHGVGRRGVLMSRQSWYKEAYMMEEMRSRPRGPSLTHMFK